MTNHQARYLFHNVEFVKNVFDQQSIRIKELEGELRACLLVLRLQRPVTHGHHCSCGVCVRLRAIEQVLGESV